MPQKKYLVTLTAEEREHLTRLVSAGKRSARTLTRARILLKADQADGGPAWEDAAIADALGCGHRTVERVRQRFVEQGLDAALTRKPQDRPSRERTLDGAAEARLIALACSAPPAGRARWTLKLLADQLVELEVVEAVSDETVRRALKKRAEAAPEAAVGDPAARQRGVCGADGGRAGGVPPAVRRAAAAGVRG